MVEMVVGCGMGLIFYMYTGLILNININILPRGINHINRYGPVVQVRCRSSPFRIPSAQVGYGWGLRMGGKD